MAITPKTKQTFASFLLYAAGCRVRDSSGNPLPAS